MARLVPCSGCVRHVRVSEASCPFCGVALSDELRATPAPASIGQRLSRAALVASGVAATVVSLEACGGESEKTPTPTSSSSSSSGSGTSSGDGTSGGLTSSGTAAPVYGAPAMPDAGGGPVVGPVYGAPVMTDGGK